MPRSTNKIPISFDYSQKITDIDLFLQFITPLYHIVDTLRISPNDKEELLNKVMIHKTLPIVLVM